MFTDLITELKKVKTEKDITPELTEMITDMAIATNMTLNTNLHGVQDDKQVFNMARMVILNHFDNYLLAISDEENFDEF